MYDFAPCVIDLFRRETVSIAAQVQTLTLQIQNKECEEKCNQDGSSNDT